MNNVGTTSVPSAPEIVQNTGPLHSGFTTSENNATFLSLSAISDLEIAEPEEIAKKLQERCDVFPFKFLFYANLWKSQTADEITHPWFFFNFRLEKLEEVHNRRNFELRNMTEEISTLSTDLVQCKTMVPALANRFQFYQDLRGYVTDLVECLDEKVRNFSVPFQIFLPLSLGEIGLVCIKLMYVLFFAYRFH